MGSPDVSSGYGMATQPSEPLRQPAGNHEPDRCAADQCRENGGAVLGEQVAERQVEECNDFMSDPAHKPEQRYLPGHNAEPPER